MKTKLALFLSFGRLDGGKPKKQGDAIGRAKEELN